MPYCKLAGVLVAAVVGGMACTSIAGAQTHTINFENDAIYPEPGLNPFPTTPLHNLTDGLVTFSSPAIDGSCCYLSQARVGSFGFFGGGPMAGQPQPSGPLNTRRFARVQCFTNPNDPQMREGYLELQFAVPVDSVAFTFGTLPNDGNSRPTISINAETFAQSGESLGVFPFTSTVNIAPIAPATAEGSAQLPPALVISKLRLKGIGACDFSSAYQFVVDNITFREAPNEPPCAADFDGVDGVTITDIFVYLNAWFAGSDSADFDDVDGVTITDIFVFLNAWFTGC